jgi:hypothetical protein
MFAGSLAGEAESSTDGVLGSVLCREEEGTAARREEVGHGVVR